MTAKKFLNVILVTLIEGKECYQTIPTLPAVIPYQVFQTSRIGKEDSYVHYPCIGNYTIITLFV